MKIIDKIFRDKKTNSVIYIILAVGIVLLVCGNSSLYVSKSNESTGQAEISVNTLSRETQEILSEIKGVGEVRVMISFSEEVKKGNAEERSVEGVLVVADGGASASVCEKIVRATAAALGVDAHKIEVFERKE